MFRVLFDSQQYVDAVQWYAPVTAKGIDRDIVGFAGKFFVHVEPLADDIRRSSRVSLDESQRFNLGLQEFFDLRAIALDSIDRRTEAGKRNGDILCRMGQQRVAFPFREDRIGWSNHDAINSPDLERVVHQFFVANR